MKAKTYNHEIAAAINNFLTEDDWKFRFIEEHGVFQFGAAIDGKMKYVDYIVNVREHNYTAYARYPLGVDMDDQEQVGRMCEFMARANEGLIRGSFVMDFDDGEVSFKYTHECDESVPEHECVKHSILLPAVMANRYAPGVLDILFGSASPKEAVEKCEGNRNVSEDTPDQSDAAETSAESDDGSPGDLDALLAKLEGLLADTVAEDRTEDSQ